MRLTLFITTFWDVKNNIAKIILMVFVLNTIFVSTNIEITFISSRNMAKVSSMSAKEREKTQSGDNSSVERTLKTPQQVIESVIFSGVKRSDDGKKPSIYEERLLAHIILEAQKCLKGVKISDHLSDDIADIHSLLTPEMQSHKYYPMQIPLKEIAGTSNNYDHVAEACANLMSKIVRVDDETHIRLRQLIVGADYAKDGTGNLYFDVPKEVWLAILDFSKGFRKYEIRMAAELTNPYAYLLYKFVAAHKMQEGDWPVSYLREQLQLKDKYPRLADLKQKILIPAINDLDTLSPVSCNLVFYSSKKALGEGRRGARTLDRVKVTPVIKLGEGSHDELAYKISGHNKISLLPNAIVVHLKRCFMYDDFTLERHAEKLLHAYEIMKGIDGGFEKFLFDLTQAVKKYHPNSYPKYLMGSVNKRVAEIEASRNAEEQKSETVDVQKPVVAPVENRSEAKPVPAKSNKKDSDFKKIGDCLPLIWED